MNNDDAMNVLRYAAGKLTDDEMCELWEKLTSYVGGRLGKPREELVEFVNKNSRPADC
jgi:hypothetical protein